MQTQNLVIHRAVRQDISLLRGLAMALTSTLAAQTTVSVPCNLDNTLYEQVAGAPAQTIPEVRFTDAADLEAARAEFRRDLYREE